MPSTTNDQFNSAIGQHLATLREDAKRNQADVAKKMTVSPARISRIESGDRTVTIEEALNYLDALDTPPAQQFRTYLAQDWTMLPKPAFDHPDRDLLWKASDALQSIQTLYENPNLKYVFRQQVEAYESALRKLAAYLHQREHLIAVIGGIGAGKTTTICQLTGLENGNEPALEVGGGGITLCEVHLKQGPQYGIIIEPRTDEEIRADVTDFCDYLTGGGTSPDDEESGDVLGISKEVIRAIRNMAQIGIKKQKDAQGKFVRHDPAKELASTATSSKELLVEVLSKMDLPRRDRRDFWYPEGTTISPLAWLQETFLAINNGRQPDCTLPRRIDIIMPRPVLDSTTYGVRIVDTKGVDQTAERPDLETHFDDPHTVIVLCSRFNDAPEAATQQLLQRARDARIQNLASKASILVLPRPEESRAMKYDDGNRVDTDAEGYDLKREQIDLRLQHLGLNTIPSHFHNARTDDPKTLRDFLLDRIEDLRNAHRAQLDDTVGAVHNLITHHEDEQRHAILRHAAQRFQVWARDHESLKDLAGQVEQSLINAMFTAHASTIRASTRREGNWPNLNYSHHLGFGARRIAAGVIGKNAAALKTIAENLLHDEQFAEAHDFITQVVSVLDNASDEFLRTVQLAGSTAYADDLKTDPMFWIGCNGEWGQGPGYRDRVIRRNKDWFCNHTERDRFIKELINNGWQKILTHVTRLLANGTTAGATQ